MVNEELKHEKVMELKAEQNAALNALKDIEEPETEKHGGPNKVKDIEELKPDQDAMLNKVEDVAKETNLEVSKGVEEFKLMESIEEMQLKLNELESNLNEVLNSII